MLAASPAGADPLGLEAIFSSNFEIGILCGWQGLNYDPPSTAVDPLTVTGTLTSIVSGNPIGGATIEARRTGDDVVLDSDVTTGTGEFSLSVVTGGVPIDLYFAMSATNYPSTYVYNADPLFQDLIGLPARALQTNELALAYILAGVSQNGALGTTALLVIDCDNAPVAGATVSFAPPAGAVRYFVGGAPTGTVSTSENGLALGMNAPVGEATVSANKAGFTFVSHAIESYAGGLSFTVIHP